VEDRNEMADMFVGEETTELVEQCKLVASLYDEKKAINKELEDKKDEFSVAQDKLLAIMERDGISSLVVGDRTVFKRENIYVSVNKSRIHEAFGWLRKNGFEGLIQEGVNSRTLSSAYQEMVQQELDVPTELFNVNPKSTIGVNVKKRG